MKKLLLLTTLLITSFAQSQNSAATQAIIDRVKQNDERKLEEKKAQEAKRVLKNITYFDQRSFLDIKKPLITGF